MNIVLIGYRGTGKSAVSKILAGKLSLKAAGMDSLIEEKAGMSIPEIVQKEGWPGFRDRESALALELSKLDGTVIDTGGGVIERMENMRALGSNALTVWLKAGVDTIVARIGGSTNRPALVNGKTFTEEVAEVLERRTPLYQAAARYSIDTDNLTPDEIAGRIAAWFEKEQNG